MNEFGSEALAVADRFHRFGALIQAENLYEHVLRQQPDDAKVWSRLAEVRHALGQHERAAGCYRQALALQPGDAALHNNLGVVLLEHGRPHDAAACCREALHLRPGYAEAANNLGVALLELGRLDEAVACYREALGWMPAYAAAHSNLGNALARQGRLEEAAASYRQAAQLQPDFAETWVNLGKALRGLGRRDDAAACYEQAQEVWPDDVSALNELGALRLGQNQPAEAVAYYERALQLQPDAARTYNNLGLALVGQGRRDEAALSFQQALYLQPDLAEAHNNLGLARLYQGQREEAVISFQRAIQLQSDLAEAHSNMGLALAALGKLDDALTCYERTVQMFPNHVEALTNLGNACKDQGRLTEATAYYRRGLAVRPDDAKLHSNLLLALNYHPGIDPQEILGEAQRYAEHHAAPLAETIKPHQVQPLVNRRLRIGYVSGDFRDHPVAYFLEPILSAHDGRHFEIFCYADVPAADAVTQRLQGYADQWRSLAGLSDAQAAEVIRQDAIDILVDLAGHTGHNRLLVFARKPAPVQASYLGYLGTTGMPTIDYYVTDSNADPPGMTDAHYQEELVRLPECAFCYRPGPAPEVRAEPPARQSGQVTFACLNATAKLSQEVLALWSRLLGAVSGARLLLQTGAGRLAEERIRAIFARHDISPERVPLTGLTPSRFEYLQQYQEVDLCLDPLPYNGVTTTCDALWMGVPVVTLAGRTSVSRQGVRFLRGIGLEELIAETPAAYVRIAADLAGDLARLTALRSGLRERMMRSPLMDSSGLTRHLEAAYRGMWDRWAVPARA